MRVTIQVEAGVLGDVTVTRSDERDLDVVSKHELMSLLIRAMNQVTDAYQLGQKL